MKGILIANIIGLTIGLLATTVFFWLFIRAERKLAKHGESIIYKKGGASNGDTNK